jgi:hypothetical protein
MHVIEKYGEVKRGANPKLSIKQRKKAAASEALYVQAEAKREYLASVKGVERNLKGVFGVGNAARISSPGLERFKTLAEMVYGALKYDDKTTTYSFYRWFETLTDEDLKALAPAGLLGTQYQDDAGRQQFCVYVDGGKLKQPGSNGELEPFSTKDYKTNFAGDGWSIFVISEDGPLYANNHDDVAGWFHAAFMGGKPYRSMRTVWSALCSRARVENDRLLSLKPA